MNIKASCINTTKIQFSYLAPLNIVYYLTLCRRGLAIRQDSFDMRFSANFSNASSSDEEQPDLRDRAQLGKILAVHSRP